MDECKRKIMNENRERLLELLDVRKFLQMLRKIPLFAEYMQSFNEQQIHRRDISYQKQYILNNFIQTNEDYDLMALALLHIGCDQMALILSPICNDMADLSRCDPKNGHIEKFSFHSIDPNGGLNDKCELEWKKLSLSSDSGLFNMASDPRGYCLLINNYFTIGTYKEMQRFRNIFYQLHFDVIMEKNLTANQIERKLKEVTAKDLSKHNAFALMVISHGNSKREIYGFDDQPLKIDYVMNIVNNVQCPQLRNKPKMFFFNCCRGDTVDLGFTCLAGDSDGDSREHMRCERKVSAKRCPKIDEYFVCFSTLDGYIARVDWFSGTFFGDALAKAFVERSYKDHLNDILTKANRSLKSMMNKLTHKEMEDLKELHTILSRNGPKFAKQILADYSSKLCTWEACITKKVYFNFNDKKELHD